MNNYTVLFLKVTLIWNAITLIIYGMDKFFATKKLRRVSELTLILIAFLGGGVGAVLGMLLFRHKTQKLKFQIAVPLAAVLTVAGACYICFRFLA